MSFADGNKIAQNSLNNHGQIVRVFNEDFVKDNLRFIVDDEFPINSFAILGEDNTNLEEEIEKHESELGSEDDKSSLVGKLHDAEKTFSESQNAYCDKNSILVSKLRDKANKPGTGIKHNRAFGDANYDVTKIKSDINSVSKASYIKLTDDEVKNYRELLNEDPKNEIKEFALFNLNYSALASKTKDIVEKRDTSV